MSALLLSIKKIIAVLTAIFIPTSTAAPAIPQHARVVKVSVFEHMEVVDSTQMEIVEDEENSNPVVDENTENNEDPATETPVEESIAPVETWDVSATENDNVTMSFYDTEDTDTLINQLAGRITALFAPMTAYAADDRVVEDNEDFTRLEDGDSAVDIIHKDQGTVGDGDFGQGAGEASQGTYKAGTVVVSGTGAMMDYVYNYFVGTDLYVDTVVKLFKEVKGIDVRADYDDTLKDIVELDATIKYIDIATGEEVFVDEEIRQNLNPADMLKYSPTHIIIKDGVTNISDYAFAMCANIVSVEMPESVTAIGNGAFAYCTNLETVKLPAALQTIGESAFEYCTALDNIVLTENITAIEMFALDNIAVNATITIPNETVNNAFLAHHDAANFNVIHSY